MERAHAGGSEGQPSVKRQRAAPDLSDIRQWLPTIELEACEVDAASLAIIADIACDTLGGIRTWPMLRARKVRFNQYLILPLDLSCSTSCDSQ